MFAGSKTDRTSGHLHGAVVSKGPRDLRLPVSLAAVCIAIIVATAGIYGYLYVLARHAHRDAVFARKSAVQLDDQQFTLLKQEEVSDSAKGQYATAASAWAAYAKKTSSKDHRGKALQHAGLLYVTAGEYQQALGYFQKAATVTGLTYTEATEIATAAARAGNKTVAIQYLQKSIQLMPSGTPDPVAQKQLFNSEIDQLKQGGS